MNLKATKKNIIILDNNLFYVLNKINFPTGGASVQSSNWLKGFETLGYNTIVLSNIKLRNNSRFSIEYIVSGNTIYKFFISFYQYFRILNKFKPKFIYVSEPWWNYFLLFPLCKFFNIKIILRISNDNWFTNEVFSKFSSKFKFFLYKFSLKFVDLFLCQNSFQYNSINSKLPNKLAGKLHNPFHNNFVNYSNESREYVAWIGLFQKQKNLGALLQIVTKLPNINFKIAGSTLASGDIDLNTNKNLIELKNCNNVEFVGLLSKENIFNFLSKAYCLLNTSHIEGFSNTFLEAFSVGTPIITRTHTDPDQIISQYNLGHTSNSYSDLPELIKLTISNPIDPNTIIAYLNNNHNPAVLSRELINLLDTI